MSTSGKTSATWSNSDPWALCTVIANAGESPQRAEREGHEAVRPREDGDEPLAGDAPPAGAEHEALVAVEEAALVVVALEDDGGARREAPGGAIVVAGRRRAGGRGARR